MNLSEIVDRIVELRQGVSPDEHVAEYIESTLRASGAQVQTQAFAFSERTLAFVGAAVFFLSTLFLWSVFKRRRRAAFLSALAIPLILLLELSLDFHVVSWPNRKKAVNIVASFPVQDAARTVIVGTHMAAADTGGADPLPERFRETVSAFLLPVTLVMALLGLWQLVMHFGKIDFEDAHTIVLIMGFACVLYYALWFGMFLNRAGPLAVTSDPSDNAGSIAVLTGLAQELSNKYPRLESTGVMVAFFGGSGREGYGARSFARNLSTKKGQKRPTYFIGCDGIGRGGLHAYAIPGSEPPGELYADRELVRILNRTAVAVTGRQPQTELSTVTDAKGFATYGYPAIAITTLPRPAGDTDGGPSGFDPIDRGQLLLSLQLLERTLQEFEKPLIRQGMAAGQGL